MGTEHKAVTYKLRENAARIIFPTVIWFQTIENCIFLETCKL